MLAKYDLNLVPPFVSIDFFKSFDLCALVSELSELDRPVFGGRCSGRLWPDDHRKAFLGIQSRITLLSCHASTLKWVWLESSENFTKSNAVINRLLFRGLVIRSSNDAARRSPRGIIQESGRAGAIKLRGK